MQKCDNIYLMEKTLKELRIANKYTQEQASKYLGVSLRSYKSYENDISKTDTIKYKYMVAKLEEKLVINETTGLLSIDEIKGIVSKVFAEYPVNYCYLFGSYAKGKEKPESDVDLLISVDVRGLKFYGLVEKLRSELHKNVDLLQVNQLTNNADLLNEILKDGIKIYG